MESKKPSNPYEYTTIGDRTNSYFFPTVSGLVYEVKFIPSTDYFNAYSGLEIEVFEMTISIADNPLPGKKLPADERVAPTIFAIFEGFFLAQRHAIVFICDSTDGRGYARYRKFGHWFQNKNARTDEMAKLDRIVVDDDERIYLSLVLSRHHPKLSRITDIFFSMGEEGK